MGHATQKQFLVSVKGIPGYYATFSGGEVTAETTDSWDGGTDKPEVIAGSAVTANLVLGRPYDPARDQPIIDRSAKVVGKWRTTVTVQPTDADWVPIGKPKTYPDSLLVRVTPPEADAASSSNAPYELEFKTPGVA